MKKVVRFEDRPCKRAVCKETDCVDCPLAHERRWPTKKKKKSGVVKVNERLSLNQELANVQDSVRIGLSRLKGLQDDLDVVTYERRTAELRRKMRLFQAEMDRIESDHVLAPQRIEETERDIVKHRRRLKVLRNKSKIEQLARMAAEAKAIEKELRDKGLQVPEA